MTTTRPACLQGTHAHLEALSDAELDARRDGLAADLARQVDAGLKFAEAKRRFSDEGQPLEFEACWRQGNRLRATGDIVPVMFVTVGAQAESPTQAMLLQPAEHYVLLHTAEMFEKAEAAKANLMGAPGRITFAEVDDVAPARMYRAIHEEAQRRRGAPIVIDLTGGFKTMSATAAAAGFGLPGARVRYVETDQMRGAAGGSAPFGWFRARHTELDNPYTVFATFDRETARLLAQGHKLGAAAQKWQDVYERSHIAADWHEGQATLAAAMEERLAFAEAAATWEALATRMEQDAKRGQPVAQLHTAPNAEPREQERPARFDVRAARTRAARCRTFAEVLATPARAAFAEAVVDLLAFVFELAERRKAQCENAVAALLYYRVVEGCTQRRLARRGLDVNDFNWDVAYQGKSSEEIDAIERKYFYATDAQPYCRPEEVGAAQGLAALRGVLDDGAMTTDDDLKKAQSAGTTRNDSVLAHGWVQVSDTDLQALRRAASKMLDATCRLEDAPTRNPAERRAAFGVPTGSP